MSRQRTSFLDLPGEIRNEIYNLYAWMPKRQSVAEFGANYQYRIEPFLWHAQIAHELKTTMLANNTLYLNVQRGIDRDTSVYPDDTAYFDKLTGPLPLNWRIVRLPPLHLRPYFRHVYIPLCFPMDHHSDFHTRRLAADAAGPNPPYSDFCSAEDWLRPLRVLQGAGFDNVKQLTIDVEYCYPYKQYAGETVEMGLKVVRRLKEYMRKEIDLVAFTYPKVKVNITDNRRTIREGIVEREVWVDHDETFCYGVDGEKLACNCLQLATLDY